MTTRTLESSESVGTEIISNKIGVWVGTITGVCDGGFKIRDRFDDSIRMLPFSEITGYCVLVGDR